MLRTTIATISMLAAWPAVAQQICADRETILGSLSADFSEKPAALGMGDDGNIVELLTSRDGGTWTILVTTPQGVSCVVATGEAWEDIPKQLAGSGT